MNQSHLQQLWSECTVRNGQEGKPTVILSDIKLDTEFSDDKSFIISLPAKPQDKIKFSIIECTRTETYDKMIPSSNASSFMISSINDNSNHNNSIKTASSSCSVDVNCFYSNLKDRCISDQRAHKKRKLSNLITEEFIMADYNTNNNSNNNNDDSSFSMINQVSPFNRNNNDISIGDNNDVNDISMSNNNDITNIDCDTILFQNSSVLLYKNYVLDGNQNVNYEFMEMGTFDIGTCALRLVAQLNRNSKCIGTLLLVKHANLKHDIQLTAVPVGYLSKYWNNPKKLVEEISTQISLYCGINVSFTPTVIGKDHNLDRIAGICYLLFFQKWLSHVSSVWWFEGAKFVLFDFF